MKMSNKSDEAKSLHNNVLETFNEKGVYLKVQKRGGSIVRTEFFPDKKAFDNELDNMKKSFRVIEEITCRYNDKFVGIKLIIE